MLISLARLSCLAEAATKRSSRLTSCDGRRGGLVVSSGYSLGPLPAIIGSSLFFARDRMNGCKRSLYIEYSTTLRLAGGHSG